MTVGELARLTGMSAKAIRQFEALCLIYSAGRSEANYRLSDHQMRSGQTSSS
jgi:DNA-binding transcriptional MerR regulator